MEIQESLERLLASPVGITDLFYIEFLDRYPEIRDIFHGIDLKRQALQLAMTLTIVERHYRRAYPTTERYLRQLGEQHQQRRKVPPDAYPRFRDCLLETLAKFHGADWDESLARQWGEALDLAARTMLAGYSGPGTSTTAPARPPGSTGSPS